MKTRMLGSKAAQVFCTFAAVCGLGSPAAAELLNIDIEGDPPNDTTHGMADGILSSAGTVWNGVEAGVSVAGLLNEFGLATSVDVVFSGPGAGATDPSSSNDLQDSGTFGTFDVRGLDSMTLFDVAIYAVPSSFIAFTDSTGLNPVFCNAVPTYSLPGALGDDYCLFEDRIPADLGGGEFGFTIAGLDGVMTGVQILGNTPPPAPVPALALPGIAALSLCLLGVGSRSVRSLSSR